MLSKEYLSKRERYYKNICVQFALLKGMRDREVVFMDRKENWKCIRGLVIRSIDSLKKTFEIYNFFDKDYNIYISVAKYRYIPFFTNNLLERSKETSEWFKTEGEKQQYDYNILFDFDNRYRKKINNKWEWIIDRTEMIKNIKYLIKNIIPKDFKFYIIPSGNNFQIVVENKLRINKEKIKTGIKAIKEKYDLKFLCLSGMGHAFKLMKCPYSICGEIVCLPLNKITDNTLNNYNNYDTNQVLFNVKLPHREVITHWGNGNGKILL